MNTPRSNPLTAHWETRYGLPPFDALTSEDFAPALVQAMQAHEAEVRLILDDPAPPTFENTVLALERSGRLLRQVTGVFYNLILANTDDVLDTTQREMSPRLSAHWSKIITDARLFARVDALVRDLDRLGLDAESRRLLERTHLGMVRAGAQLSEADRERMSAILGELAGLGARFTQNVLRDERTIYLPLDSDDDLDGLPAPLVAAAAEAARERGLPHRGVITLSRSLVEPFLTFSRRRDLRARAFELWIRRGEGGGETDNLGVISRTLTLRRERAALLGYPTFAAYKLDDTMAKTPETVRALIHAVWEPALRAVEQERALLVEAARAEGQTEPLAPHDWRYFAEKVRAARFDLDEAEVKPYFPVNRVVEAAFATARRLFGVTFTPVHGLPVYHPDVSVYEVTDAKGAHVGLFLHDLYARPSKRSGAWSSAFRAQERLDGEVRPIIVNVLNLARAPEGQVTLLTQDEARVIFHELGHGLHGLLSDVTYPSLSGTSVARDFVELPSQLMEHWIQSEALLGEFARHAETGAPIPPSLLARLRAARNFNQGFGTVEFLASAMVDLDMHTTDGPFDDPARLEAESLARLGLPPEIVSRHRAPHFAHIFSGDGYSAGYYSYLWSAVLDADAFAAFEETGDLFDPATAARLKDVIYSAGGRRPEDEAYRLFRGKMPSVDGLLRVRGFLG
ncbi:M3 family metallopeptidase [Myxococcota bacterium]|nr:M3 family metallopeptidase [Myxococcota bacterium]